MHSKHLSRTARWAAVALAAALAAAPAVADKPDWAGGGKAENPGKERPAKADRRGDDRDGRERRVDGGRRDPRGGVTVRFDDRHRGVVREYYAQQFRAGHCPPGLAKKGNGCMPPGQAKKWRVGRPLPRDVTFYDLPPAIVVELGVPPAGHRFVRVASDILLIAVGTGMVIDAIEDLGRM